MAFGADTPLVAARKFGLLAKGMADLPKTTLGHAALSVKRSVEAQMQLAGVHSGKLRGVGTKGGRIGVRYDPLGQHRVLLRATGPFHLIENKTKAGRRVPRQRARRPGVMVIPGVGVRAWANHPGTSGKHPWAKGVALAPKLVENAGQAALKDVVTRIFR